MFFTFKAQQRQEEKEKEQIIIERKLDELLNAQRAIYTITKRGMGKDGKLPFESQGDADLLYFSASNELPPPKLTLLNFLP